ncbi:Ser-Thr-rich glycosyl-phosphatidyl-inositol-anchored membrane family-domain-containing protein [Phyllosticta citrichinensis]|uniref:Ser-Thr-rich glycosyl-phosphatidyl-inositol-anchored membrane family-domain-containing protein n=1 Tax=Phyllosticta citrichinensis TaxID=1130410 RepID=A0ABR1Y2V3_9PEZI
MRFSSAIPIIVAGLSALAAAAGENAFIVPMSGFNPEAGKDSTIQWEPTAGKTVTLKLRQGASSNLGSGATIAANIPNDGSYTWSVPTDVVRGTDYSIQIVNDDNTSQTNYYPYFTIQSTNVVAVSSSAASSAAASSAAASSTESASKTSASKTSATDASVTALDVSSTASASATKSGASSTLSTASRSSATEESAAATSTPGSAPTSGASAIARELSL